VLPNFGRVLYIRGIDQIQGAPRIFGKAGEDAADWMDRYEVLEDYNRWTDADKWGNF
jgi:hypothetical protein